jgi:hypothetical protein
MTVNATSLNVTLCAAEMSPCISATAKETDYYGAISVSLTCKYSSFVNNSGCRGLNRPTDYTWYLEFCNFCNNNVTDGVLFTVERGMTVSSCIFTGNVADIGSDNELTGPNRYFVINSVFDRLPITAAVSLSDCVVGVTNTWKISSRLCPTYSPTVATAGFSASTSLLSVVFRASHPAITSKGFRSTLRPVPSVFAFVSAELGDTVTIDPMPISPAAGGGGLMTGPIGLILIGGLVIAAAAVGAVLLFRRWRHRRPPLAWLDDVDEETGNSTLQSTLLMGAEGITGDALRPAGIPTCTTAEFGDDSFF